MTGLVLELRRGPGKLVVLPLAGLGVWLVRQAQAPGPAVWPLVVSALATAASVLAPVSGGIAAWAGTRSRRRNTGPLEELASRGPAAAGLAELEALLLWMLAAFGLVVSGTYIPAAVSATWSGPDVLRTLTIGAGILLETTIGYVLGRLVPSRLTPPLAALALYGIAAYNVISPRGFGWSLLLPVNHQFFDEFVRLNQAATIGQLLWYTGVGALVVAGWALHRQGRTRALAAGLALGAVGAAAGLAVLIPQHGHANTPDTVLTWSCRGQNPQICLHPALEDARPAVTAALLPVAHRLTGTPFAIHRAEQRPRGIGSTPSPGAVAFALDDTTPPSIRLAAQELAVNALGDGATCFTETGPASGYDLAQLVGAWVVGQHGLYQPPTREAARARRWFAHLDPGARRRWFSTHVSAIRRCTLRRADFR